MIHPALSGSWALFSRRDPDWGMFPGRTTSKFLGWNVYLSTIHWTIKSSDQVSVSVMGGHAAVSSIPSLDCDRCPETYWLNLSIPCLSFHYDSDNVCVPLGRTSSPSIRGQTWPSEYRNITCPQTERHWFAKHQYHCFGIRLLRNCKHFQILLLFGAVNWNKLVHGLFNYPCSSIV